ncbi:HEAT repeat domain-containing protein [Dyella choica]|uniref:HEAT repeat domain-containing protein n=1 Tax=Dyella choica TaxID=1927959 RepID=A0A3S0RHN3_9GAMM|nr:hypothetical protein [Dyella choica]RUL70175.1 hypothetical protein EKH80_21025 [Dyella choica]
MLRTVDTTLDSCLVDQMPRFGESAVVPLAVLLRTGSENGRFNAALGLDRLRDQAVAATQALESALDDSSSSVRWAVLGSLESIQPRSPSLTLKLLRQLDREQSTSATLYDEALIRAIAHMGGLPPEALPILDHALRHLPNGYSLSVQELIETIGRVDTPERVVLLARLIGDKDPVRAWYATVAIGRSGSLALPVLLFYRLAGLAGHLISVESQ